MLPKAQLKLFLFFFFNDTATTEIYTLSLHDALPIYATLTTDPSCAMAEWGIALSRWSNPFVVGIRPAGPLLQGRNAVGRARTIGTKTDRERAYVGAVSRLYADFETTDQTARVLAYRDGMSKVAAAYPNDTEA